MDATSNKTTPTTSVTSTVPAWPARPGSVTAQPLGRVDQVAQGGAGDRNEKSGKWLD
jgi:hypothetical protein